MSSPESSALRCYSADLVTAISAADPLGLALKLFAENLVERVTVEDVCLPTNPPTTKSCIIVTAVDRKVEADPSLFHQFTALLQDEGDSLKAISKRLVDKCRSKPEEELGTSTLPPHHTPHQPSPPQPHSPLRLYADKLRALYAQSELPKYSNPACYKWTPSPSKKYIDLSTIDREGMTTKEVDESKKAALYGQINKITRKGSTNTVKLEEILQAKPGEKLQCVLIEGPPGIGKSTLAWQVCNRWGKRELFQQYSTVLLLPLRDQRVQGATRVKYLFVNLDEDLQEKVHKEVSQENWDGKDTLIVLEGLDELPSHLLSQPSIFTALLSGEVLSQATILITSRPSATEQLHKHWKQRISRHFEIRGFTQENVDKYAESVLSDCEQLSGFKEYISIHPHIQSMLYVPLHCVISVTVYLQCQQSRTPPPKTLTGLYTCLTQAILIQYLNDHPQYTGGGYTLDTVFDLCIPRPVHKLFKELCRIAFEHVSDQQLIFSDMPKELHDLGFTDAVPELLLYQQLANYSYNFLHLSIQEFLAAYHVSSMRPREQEQLLKTKFREYHKLFPPVSHLKNMFRFVAGLTKFQGLNKVVLRQAICKLEYLPQQLRCLNDYSLELLYECQDVSILDSEYTYSVKLDYPSPHQCLALGYCIANSSCGFKSKLELERCYTGTQAEMIFQGLKESKACHTSYSIKSIRCTACSTDFTHKLFTHHTPDTIIANIESLDIMHTIARYQPLPPCLPELIPRMERLNTLTLMNVLDTSLTELILALSRVPTLRNLKIQSDSGKLEMLFPTDDLLPTGTINDYFTPKLIHMFLPQLPQQTIAHIGSLTMTCSYSQKSPQPLPPCLPELIPRMERLNTLTLRKVIDSSLTELIPALSRVPTLRNLTIQSDSGKLEMLFPSNSLLPTGTINGYCTPKLIGMFLLQLPQQTIAHIGSLALTFSYSQEDPQPLPPCLTELIPRMEKLNTLTLENVLYTSLTELIPVLSRVSALRNLQMVVTGISFEMKFPAEDLSTGTIESVNCTPEFLDQILPVLSQLQCIAHITSLTVRYEGHAISLSLPPCLPEVIPRMERLKTLTLENVHDISLTELIPALSRVTTLRYFLTLSKLNTKDIVLLCQWLPTYQLKTLTLPSLTPRGIVMASRALTTVSSLKALDIRRSEFTFQSMQAFASMLQQNQSLTEVIITDCCIDKDSACCLAETLHHNTTLRKLDMSENHIGEGGGLAMAEMLKHNATLEELNLNNEFLEYLNNHDLLLLQRTHKGIMAVVESLAVNHHLKKLIISSNQLNLGQSICHDYKERVVIIDSV